MASTSALTQEKLEHFADRGWLVLDSVLSSQQCADYIAALERSQAGRVTLSAARTATTTLENILMHEGAYLEWFELPGVLETTRRLLGASRPRLDATIAAITVPHPDRATRRDELEDPDSWGWHRDFRPKWGLFPSDDDDRLVNCVCVGNITYLTTVSGGDGATAVLEGSHRLEGDYSSLKSKCPVVHVEAPAGSVLVFAETLIHTAVPITGETKRYALIYHFSQPWIAAWPGYEVPQVFADGVDNEAVRKLLVPAGRDDRAAQYFEPRL